MDSYPRCATCKWWNPPLWDELPGLLSGWCEALTKQDDLADGLIITSTDYSIYTRAAFGCIQHEPKES